ncbi:hypothetical protein BGZ49_006960 [Haplosporangium sp. Z 27]|nr:hypothetical protein BGZ49_006960 [Haplosporangium sp. Z 27]
MSPVTTLQDELAEEEKVLRAEQEWFLSTQVKPSLEAIQKSLLELTVKLPKLPVVKTAIHSNVPSNASVTSTSLSTIATTTTTTAPASTLTNDTESSGSIGNTGSTEDPSKETANVPTLPEGSETSKGDIQQTTLQGSDQSQQQPLDISTTENIATTAQNLIPKAVTSETSVDPASLPPPPPVNTHQLMNSYRPPGHLTQPYLLEQLKDVQNHTAQAIFRLKDYWSRGGGDDILARLEKKQNERTSTSGVSLSTSTSTTVEETTYIKETTRSLRTLLELMEKHLRAAIEAMARPRKEKLYPFRVCDPKIFSPTLNEDFVIEFYVKDSRLVCAAYALQLSGGPSNVAPSGGLTGYLQQALPGSSTPTSQQNPPQYLRARSSSSTTASSGVNNNNNNNSSNNSSADNQQLSTQANNGENAIKSGQTTPRPPSPSHHHPPLGTSGQPHSNPPSQNQQSGNGQTRSPVRSRAQSTTEHHPGATTAASNLLPNESIVLPSSSKVGQTSKGGINKYRGKVATTIEDKVVQVDSPKLAEISSRLAHAEALCRRLLQFLVLQESTGVSST